MELVIQKPYAKDNQNTGNCADHDGTKSIYNITACGNGNKTGKGSI